MPIRAETRENTSFHYRKFNLNALYLPGSVTYAKQLLAHFVLDSDKLLFCALSLGTAVFLNFHDLIQSADQGLIGGGQSLYIHDTTLTFFCRLDGSNFQGLGIFI